jgi:putative peptidoglycan lipid II flippase
VDASAAAAIAPSVYNVGIIFGALVLSPLLGTTVNGTLVPNPVGLALGVCLGRSVTCWSNCLPLSRLGFRFQPHLGLEDPQAKQAFVLMAPRAVGLGASQITFVVITLLATGLPETGALSAFNLGMLLLQIPLGVIGVPLGIVLLPALSTELATGPWSATSA